MDKIKIKQYTITATSIHPLTVIDIGEEENAATAKMVPHQRFHYIIHFVVSGKGTYVSDGKKSVISENTAFAVYKKSVISYESDPGNSFHYYWIGFDSPDDKIMSYIGFSEKNPVIKLNNPEEIIKAFDALFEVGRGNDGIIIAEKFFSLIVTLKKTTAFIRRTFTKKTKTF